MMATIETCTTNNTVRGHISFVGSIAFRGHIGPVEVTYSRCRHEHQEYAGVQSQAFSDMIYKGTGRRPYRYMATDNRSSQ